MNCAEAVTATATHAGAIDQDIGDVIAGGRANGVAGSSAIVDGADTG